MRKWFVLLVAIVGCTWLTGCPGGSSTVIPNPGGTDPAAEKQAMLTRHNDTRTSLGLNALTGNAQLDSAAQSHAEWMLAANNLSHTDGSGGNVGDRVTAAGYTWLTVGENIARTSSGSSAYTLWLGSAGHYANITNADFDEIGIGLASAGSTQYWCIVFAGD